MGIRLISAGALDKDADTAWSTRTVAAAVVRSTPSPALAASVLSDADLVLVWVLEAVSRWRESRRAVRVGRGVHRRFGAARAHVDVGTLVLDAALDAAAAAARVGISVATQAWRPSSLGGFPASVALRARATAAGVTARYALGLPTA